MVVVRVGRVLGRQRRNISVLTVALSAFFLGHWLFGAFTMAILTGKTAGQMDMRGITVSLACIHILRRGLSLRKSAQTPCRKAEQTKHPHNYE